MLSCVVYSRNGTHVCVVLDNRLSVWILIQRRMVFHCPLADTQHHFTALGSQIEETAITQDVPTVN